MLNIQTVSDITALIKEKLEKDIPDTLVRAEISECKFHSSGHIYMTLKDPGAVLPAVIWRNTALQLITQPAVGMEVIVYGRLSVYAPHGKYQFIIQSLQDAGLGELYIRYEALKKQLIEEGLCDDARKRAIPKYPLHVGLVTSETGAALQDMLRVFSQSAPHVKITLLPARVQGKGAAKTVIEALEGLKSVQPDCVICARGGGSIEDLWEFNNEDLARYVADYPIPLISGVGHQTDTTIIDLIADHRASTPTNAAEFICAPWREVRNTLNQMEYTLANSLNNAINKQQERLQHYRRYLSSRIISDNISNLKEKISLMLTQIDRGMHSHLQLKRSHFEGFKGKLFAYSPEHVLKKGYTLIRDRNDKLVRSVYNLSPEDRVNISFHDGSADAVINSTDKEGSDHE
ncbi:MAG: exodeoxyribonuclease VII large subunit [Candidatus Marinimicrobia bacterium]|nr:exodeoxyribonuclease VII large subunit [Candidatus Neomarinimicrobiota bacterium]